MFPIFFPPSHHLPGFFGGHFHHGSPYPAQFEYPPPRVEHFGPMGLDSRWRLQQRQVVWPTFGARSLWISTGGGARKYHQVRYLLSKWDWRYDEAWGSLLGLSIFDPGIPEVEYCLVMIAQKRHLTMDMFCQSKFNIFRERSCHCRYQRLRLAANMKLTLNSETLSLQCGTSLDCSTAGAWLGESQDMDGLFARRNLEAGELCSWYNGLRCTHEAGHA